MAAGSHWVKIDRALDHIKALDESIAAWRGDDPYTVREEQGPYVQEGRDGPPVHLVNVTRTALVLRIDPPFRAEWSAYIGDAVHNLRSALDHLAFALNSKGYADANDGADLPPAEEQASEFPVIGDEDSKGNTGQGPHLFASASGRNLRHVSDEPRRIIEDVQPYKAGQKWATDPLWLIHDLDRIDKHRQLVLAAASNPETRIKFWEAGGLVVEAVLGIPGPFEDGDELAWWAIPDSEPKADYDLDFTFGVAFGKATPCAGWPVFETLRDLRDYVRFKVAFRLDKLC